MYTAYNDINFKDNYCNCAKPFKLMSYKNNNAYNNIDKTLQKL